MRLSKKQAVALGIKLPPEAKKQGKRIKEEPPDYSLFYKLIAAAGIEKPVQEYKFHKTRKWRFDFCFRRAKLVLEIDGGAWIYGRHNRPEGFLNDMEKGNEAILYGYQVLRVTPDQMIDGSAFALVEEYFKRRGLI